MPGFGGEMSSIPTLGPKSPLFAPNRGRFRRVWGEFQGFWALQGGNSPGILGEFWGHSGGLGRGGNPKTPPGNFLGNFGAIPGALHARIWEFRGRERSGVPSPPSPRLRWKSNKTGISRDRPQIPGSAPEPGTHQSGIGNGAARIPRDQRDRGFSGTFQTLCPKIRGFWGISCPFYPKIRGFWEFPGLFIPGFEVFGEFPALFIPKFGFFGEFPALFIPKFGFFWGISCPFIPKFGGFGEFPALFIPGFGILGNFLAFLSQNSGVLGNFLAFLSQDSGFWEFPALFIPGFGVFGNFPSFSSPNSGFWEFPVLFIPGFGGFGNFLPFSSKKFGFWEFPALLSPKFGFFGEFPALFIPKFGVFKSRKLQNSTKPGIFPGFSASPGVFRPSPRHSRQSRSRFSPDIWE
ncbi:uncharacterized protein ACIQIH_000145 [Cyanocitta cristata]